jgi:hypothetical protein
MVKKAEKIQKKHPLTAVGGLLLAVSLFGVSYILAGFVVQMPQVLKVIGNGTKTTATIAFAFGIWVVLLATSFFLVAVLAGKDPASAANQMPLPPRAKDQKKKR